MPQIIGEGGPSDRNSLPLATRAGTRIRNAKRLEASPDRIRAAVEIALSTCREAKLRSATQLYNCMGLVFASRRTWIGIEEITTILDEDGYTLVNGVAQVEIGDLVVYAAEGEMTHVGIVIAKEQDISNAAWNVQVMSQWGADGEYIHPLNQVPLLLGSPFQFWTDRKALPS